MKYWASMAFSPSNHYLLLAPVLESAGFEGMVLADHLAQPEHPRSAYPYTADGRPGWAPGTSFPDVWVTAGALAAVTTALRFASSVYVAPARDLFTVAKAVATAAVLSGDRVVFGVGAGWMADEFELTGQAFETRGARLDEMLGVLRQLWTSEWVEHRGRHYSFPSVQISPRPARPVPVWGGGYSRAAVRRATTTMDGWVGVAPSEDAGERIIGELRAGLREHGRDDVPFEIVLSLPIPITPEVAARWDRLGATGLIVRPWAGRLADDLGGLAAAQTADLERKMTAARAFGVEVIGVGGDAAGSALS